MSLEQHDILTVPPEVEHTSWASSDGAKIIVFWPLREDRLSDTEYQTELATE